MWMITGIMSIVATCATILLAVCRNTKTAVSAIAAISLMSLTILSEYYLVYQWVNAEDWSALLDVVPALFHLLACYAVVIVLVNAAAVLITKAKE